MSDHERCDRLLEATEAQLAAERIQHAATRRAYEELVKDTLQMKREGFAQPQAYQERPPVAPMDARIVAAIEGSTDSSAERTRLMLLAERQVSAGMKPEQIAADFSAGEPVEL